MNSSDSSIVIPIFAFFIGIIISREILSIPRIVKHLRAQTILLARIAEKLGVDVNDARKPYFDAEGQGYKPIETTKATEAYKAE